MLRRIRALETEAKEGPVPAIALTAWASDRDREKALAAGYQRHLAKPVRSDDLLSALRALLCSKPEVSQRPAD